MDERDLEIQDADSNKEKAKRKEAEKAKQKGDWLNTQRSALMVVASLIATMAFQAALTPPDNLWANKADNLANNPPANPPANPDHISHGMSGLKSMCDYLKRGEQFFAINTTSFLASLSIILLLMSGLPMNSRFVMWILIMVTWVAISAIALSYTANVILHTAPNNEDSVYNLVAVIIYGWIALVSFLLVVHTARICFRVIRQIFRIGFLLIRWTFRLLAKPWARRNQGPDKDPLQNA